MKNVLKSKFLWVSALALAFGFVGCNLFNPTESVDIKGNDANALTYEGYLKFRNNEYSAAETYFRRAIFADSSHSEAWYGLMKSVLNKRLAEHNETNLFSLLKYAQDDRASGGTNNPLVKMDSNVAKMLEPIISEVNEIAQQFIERDKAGKNDGVITYKTISDGYMVLQALKTMVILKKKLPSGCENPKANVTGCDYATVLNQYKQDPGETMETFNAFFEACEMNPESMSNYFDDMFQGFNNLRPEAQQAAIGSMCSALAKQTKDAADDEDEQKKTLNIIIGQMAYSDITDDDGDGCIDEEVYDGEDNDGDGEIDEDVSDKDNVDYDESKSVSVVLEKQKKGQDVLISDMRIVKETKPNNKYRYVDIDMNGITIATDKSTNQQELKWEWGFFRGDYANRTNILNSYINEATGLTTQGDHRFNFATKLIWNPMGLPYSQFKDIKDSIAKVKAPASDLATRQLDLKYRQTHIGGCWANYDDDRYLKWFERRNN